MPNLDKEKFIEISSLFKRLSDEMCRTVESFYIWETFHLSRSIPTVGKEKAERNVKIINSYKNFFLPTENSHIDSFIIGISKFFDRDPRALSIQFLIDEIKKNKEIFTPETLLEVYPGRFDEAEIAGNYLPMEEKDELVIEKLREKHVPLINKLKLIRDTQSAHTDIQPANEDFVPKEVEELINAIQEMLNTISSRFDRASTCWDYIKDNAIRDTEFLFDSLEKGEFQRKKEIEERWADSKDN